MTSPDAYHRRSAALPFPALIIRSSHAGARPPLPPPQAGDSYPGRSAFRLTPKILLAEPAVRLAESMRPDVKKTLGFVGATPVRRARARGRPAAGSSDGDARADYLELVARGG